MSEDKDVQVTAGEFRDKPDQELSEIIHNIEIGMRAKVMACDGVDPSVFRLTEYGHVPASLRFTFERSQHVTGSIVWDLGYRTSNGGQAGLLIEASASVQRAFLRVSDGIIREWLGKIAEREHSDLKAREHGREALKLLSKASTPRPAIKVAHDPDADPYYHPITDEILEAIEMMAEHSPDVESGDVSQSEVVEFWMTAFREHAKAAVEGARREMAWKEIER